MESAEIQGGTATAGAPGRRRRWPLALVLLLGLLVQLPTLRVGFFADDYAQQLVLAGERGPVPVPRWNLYDFGTAEEWRAFGAEHEGLPWWTGSDWKVRFFRPLTSLTLVADHALWGSDARGYHATSLLLWLALLVVAHRLYLALGLAPRAAMAALLVLALSDASAIPVGWIANRNALLEALLAAGAVLAALRGRAGVAILLGVAAALSKESGALVFPVVAWVLWRAGRARPASGALALLAVHVAFLALAGYGTRSLFYATPWSDPGRFLANLGVLATGGVLSLLGPVPLDVVTIAPLARVVLVALGLLAGWPLWRWILRRVPEGSARTLAAGWTVLFLLPQASAPPSDRLLLVPVVGAAALLGAAWSAERARWRELARPARLGRLALAASATLGSGLYLLAHNLDVLPGMANHLRAKALATEVGPPAPRREVLVLQSENHMQAFTLGATWHAEIADESVRFSVLHGGPRALRWTRTGERELTLESLGAPFLDTPFEYVYRTDPEPPAVGTRWRASWFEVEAVAADAAGLRAFRVILDRSLDDPSLRFVRPIEGVLSLIAPPALGASLDLPAAIPTRPFMP
ncbi:MAG TPA: hypothetical protein VF530_10330 [Planctomycetota bacterium]